MRMLKTLGAAILAAALPCLAVAQTNPNLTNMQVLTPGQWNNLFASKQDTLGFTPMNSNGGTFLGRVVTAPPGASTAGLNLTPGATPGSPANGDLWVTASSIFARINGVTLDLIGAACANCALTNAANTFTGSQIIQTATTTQPGWFVQITGDTTARVRLGLNSTDTASLSFGPGSAARDTFLERAGPAAFRLGGNDAAAPIAQTLGVQNVVAGTSNTAGAALTMAGSRGTGTGVGGSINFQVAPAGSTGSAQNALVNALSISSAGAATLTSASPSCLAIGPTGLTNSALNVDCSTASLAAGLNIKGAATGGTVGISLTDPGSSTNLTINAKGTGTIGIGGVSTGAVTIAPPLTLSAALTYGGNTFANSVTGTAGGSLVSSIAPTITGSPTFTGSNFLTLANIVQDTTAWSLLGNATSGTANYAPFTIGGLTSKASIAGTDLIMISDQAAGGALKQVTVSQVAAGATVSSIAGNTGAFTLGGLLTNSVNLLQVVAATKTDQQAASSATLAVTPLHQQDHDSAAKAWGSFSGLTAACPGNACVPTTSYNMSSITHTGTGLYTLTFNIPFASANYSCHATNNQFAVSFNTTRTAGQATIVSTNTTTPTDASLIDFVCFGRQ